MRTERGTARSTPTLAALLVFCIFASCILFALLSGARIYRKLTARGQQAFSERTCALYLTGKVRQNSDQSAITIERFGEGDCLVLPEEIGEGEYVTRIYCCDGWLWELFAERGEEFEPENGEKVLPADTLQGTLTADGMLRVYATVPDADDVELCFSLRGGAA